MNAPLLEKRAPALHLTAAEVRHRLREHYPAAEYGIAFEVANGTGAYTNVRRLDAMVMSLWPSRGLDITGIEIKVSASDWRREKANPEKAEALAKYCDFFYVAAPRGVVPDYDVPANWGLLEVHETKIVVKKRAVRLSPDTIDRYQLAAIWRAAQAADPERAAAAVAAERSKLQEEFRERVEKHAASEVERRTKRDNKAAESWRQLCAALGKEPCDQWGDNKPLIDAIKAVKRSGITNTYHNLHGLRDDLARALERVTAGLAEFPKPNEGEIE